MTLTWHADPGTRDVFSRGAWSSRPFLAGPGDGCGVFGTVVGSGSGSASVRPVRSRRVRMPRVRRSAARPAPIYLWRWRGGGFRQLAVAARRRRRWRCPGEGRAGQRTAARAFRLGACAAPVALSQCTRTAGARTTRRPRDVVRPLATRSAAIFLPSRIVSICHRILVELFKKKTNRFRIFFFLFIVTAVLFLL